MKLIYSVACGVGAFFALNCGSGDDTSYSSSGAPATTGGQEKTGGETTQATAATEGVTGVKVNGHTFDPPEVRIKAGATVKWTWVAGRHNVVSGASCSPDGKFTSGTNTVGPGSTFEQKFETAGAFPYYCDPHCGMGMTGTVIVE